MKLVSLVRSVVFGFAVVSVLGASSASAAASSPVKNGAAELVFSSLDGDISTRDLAKAGVHVATIAGALPATISALSGAAATSATLAAIVTGVAMGLAWSFNALFLDED